MPLASKHAHGIVKIGSGLVITPDGVVSVDFNEGWYASIKNDVDVLKIDVSALKIGVDDNKTGISDLTGRVITIEQSMPRYQTKQDSFLETVSKTIVGGINEVKDQTVTNETNISNVAKDIDVVKKNYATTKYVDALYGTISMGGARTFVFDTRQDFINWLDGSYTRKDNFKPKDLHEGDIVLLKEKNVPDYWLSQKSEPITIVDFEEYESKIEVPDVEVDNVSISKNANNALQSVALKNGFIKLNDVVTRDDFKGWIELRQDQYDRLVKYGSIEVGDEIVVFDDDDVYVTPDTSYYVLQGHTAPTESTIGYIGEFYLDLVSKTLYQCVEVDNTTQTYTWKAVGGGVSEEDFNKLVNNETQIKLSNGGFLGGGAKNDSSFTSYYSRVISIGNLAEANALGVAIGQNARAKANGSGCGNVAIGSGAETGKAEAVAIGQDAKAKNTNTIAAGYKAEATVGNAIQLGKGTNATENTLQIFDKNIYNHSTDTLTVTNITLNGENLADKLGGDKKYQHNLSIKYKAVWITFNIITSDSSAYTTGRAVSTALYNNGFNRHTNLASCDCVYGENSDTLTRILGLYSIGNNFIYMSKDTIQFTLNPETSTVNIGENNNNVNGFMLNDDITFVYDVVVEV